MPKRSKHWLAHPVLWLMAVLYVGPLAWMLLTSLKPEQQVAARPHAVLPERVEWRNYVECLDRFPVLLQLHNSVLLCMGTVVGSVLSCSLAAYGFSKLRWPGRDVLFALVIATLALPFHVTMVPRFGVIRALGLYDTLWALILPAFFGYAFTPSFSIIELISTGTVLDGPLL